MSGENTVPSPLLVTHTSPPVTVTAAGLTPTAICPTTAWVAGSIRDTVPPVRFTAQTELARARRPGYPRPPRRQPIPAESIRPTLLPGKPVGSPAHGRATATMHTAAATASAEPTASRRRGRRHTQPSSRRPAIWQARRPGRRGANPGRAAFRRGGAAAVPVQRGIVGENGGVQAPQRLSGIDPELGGEQVAEPPVGGQRVGLPAGTGTAPA